MQQMPKFPEGGPGDIYLTYKEMLDSGTPRTIEPHELTLAIAGMFRTAHEMEDEGDEAITAPAHERKKYYVKGARRRALGKQLMQYLPEYTEEDFNIELLSDNNEGSFISDDEVNEFLTSLEKNDEIL